MPQMMPMYWLIQFMFMILMFMLMNCLIYFQFMPIKKNFKWMNFKSLDFKYKNNKNF